MADSRKSKRGVTPKNFVPCSSCRRIKPRPEQDLHALCPRCRPCNRQVPCSVCKDWGSADWEAVAAWVRSRSPSGESAASASSGAVSRAKKTTSAGRSPLSGVMPKGSLATGKASGHTTKSVPVRPPEFSIVTGAESPSKITQSGEMSQAVLSDGSDTAPPAGQPVIASKRKQGKKKGTSRAKAVPAVQVATGHVIPGETGTDSGKTGTVPGNTGARPKTLAGVYVAPAPSHGQHRSRDKSDGEERHRRKRRRRYTSSSSSSSSSRSPRGHRRHHSKREDPTSALLLQGFRELTASITSLIPKPTAPAQPVAPPEPRQVLPRTEDVMSITVSDSFSDPGSVSDRDPRRVSAAVAVPDTEQSSGNEETVPLTQRRDNRERPPGREDDSSGDESSYQSTTDQRLRMVMKDMVRVLHIPSNEEPDPVEGARQSFKRRTAPVEPKEFFPVLPIDRLCADRMNALSEVKKIRPFVRRETRPFRVPQADFDNFLSVPPMPATVRDKITADSGGRSTLKSPFPSKEKNVFEESLIKIDTASRAGIRVACFLQLLSEYLVCSCEADSPVSPEATETAFRCLDDGLRLCMDQFMRVSLMTINARRTNVLDTIFVPSDGLRSNLESLPRLSSDLFGGKFQEVMQAEAKRIKATDKINLNKQSSQGGSSRPARGNSGATKGKTFPRKPLKPFAPNPSGSSFKPTTTVGQSQAFGSRSRGRAGFTPRSKASRGGYRGGAWRR